jgi:hypothetical protein
MDSNFRFRAKGATDLSFRFFVYVPETVRVLTQRSTLLGNRRFEIPVPPGQWGKLPITGNVLASAERPDGASGNRKFESISLQRRVCLASAFHDYRRKDPAFAGSVSLDVTRERDVLARSRLALAPFSDGH